MKTIVNVKMPAGTSLALRELPKRCVSRAIGQKRIGFITTIGCPWGGSEELWTRAAAGLLKQGFIVGAQVRNWGRPVRQIDELERIGCHINRWRFPNRLQRWLGVQWDQWLDSFKPDLVVVSQAVHVEGIEWMLGCIRRNIPFAVVVQCAGEGWWPDDERIAEFASAFESAAACYFVSGNNLELVRRQFATQLPKAKVIRNPFNVSCESALPWPEQDGIYRLACVARLEPAAKGQDLILDVLRRDRWRNRPIEVNLFGNGPNRDSLEKLKGIYELRNVSLKGFTPDVAGIWRHHHALVMASRYEGLPLAIVEAQLCGRPCIVTDVAGNAELVQDNVTGFLARAANPAELDEAMERAWNRRAEWKDMGEAAARFVRQQVPRDPVHAFVDELTALL